LTEYRIAMIVGSLRRHSFNRQVAELLVDLAPSGFLLTPSEIGDLPLYNQDHDQHQAATVQRLRGEIIASQGVIFVTPEYNRSIPGVLKNAIDHGSRPYGQSAWTGKPAGILGVSEGALGSALAQQHLRAILASLDMPTLAQPESYIRARADMFDEIEHIGTSVKPLLQEWMIAFVAWVQRHAAV
jgi:chromate reductase